MSLRKSSPGALEPMDIAPSRYFDAEFHRLEMERVWRRTWQMACREEQIPEAGDHVVYDIGDTSLIVIRTTADEIKAFHNSCLHRGTQLRSRAGRVDVLRCSFHGFTWNIDGSLREIPCVWDFPDVDPEQMSLPEARVGTWGGFVFVNLDPAAPPLEDYIGVLPEHFADWPLEERTVAVHVVRKMPCNWKVALEAFIEAYHTVVVHPQLLSTAADTLTQYDVYGPHVSRMITAVGIQSEHRDRDLPEAEIVAEMTGRPVAEVALEEGDRARAVLADRIRAVVAKRTGGDVSARSDAEALDGIEYFLFPNFMPWGGLLTAFVYRFRPDGHDPDSCVIDIMKLDPLPAGGARPKAAPTRHLTADETWADVPELGAFGRVFNQDGSTFGRIQRGLRASVKPTIITSRYQESRVRHFHATLDDYLSRP